MLLTLSDLFLPWCLSVGFKNIIAKTSEPDLKPLNDSVKRILSNFTDKFKHIFRLQFNLNVETIRGNIIFSNGRLCFHFNYFCERKVLSITFQSIFDRCCIKKGKNFIVFQDANYYPAVDILKNLISSSRWESKERNRVDVCYFCRKTIERMQWSCFSLKFHTRREKN